MPTKPCCPAPEKSPSACCGQREATVVAKLAPPDRPLLATPPLIEVPAVAGRAVEALTNVAVAVPGPPLHLLHCVWRC